MERRLSAILAADMVGYSRLMEADEMGTLARHKLHRGELIDPALQQYRGRIVKEVGDGVLAEFASVVDAVQCAVDIQRAMPDRETDVPENRRIAYRIGINLGDILVEDGDIYGDGVNVAARLEQLAEPDGICVSGTAYDHLRSQTGVGFESLGEIRVKNIARPIRAYRVLTDPEQAGVFVTARPNRARVATAILLPLLFLAIAGTLVWLYSESETGPNEAHGEQRSIAVLPFENISGNPEQEYFVDGITDDLITDLSQISSLFVIARDSVFAFKGQTVDYQEIARELGARYLLDGSVRSAGNRIRINSQLIDTRTGGQIWAERFDRELKDIFTLQDDVTSQIVAAMAVELTPAEKERLTTPDDVTTPEVYDLYLRGVQALRRFTPESISLARHYFLQALAYDPGYARAYATLAFTYTASGYFFRETDTEQALQEAVRYSRQALEIKPDLPQAHFALALALLRQGRHSEALAAARNAVEFDPNYADGYVTLANVLVFSGESEEGLRYMRKAMDLNPRYSAGYLDSLGRAYFVARQFDQAVSSLQECIGRDPNAIVCRVFLAASYAQAGLIEDAQWETQELLNLQQNFSEVASNISVQFRRPEDRELFNEGLEIAGLAVGRER